MVVTIIFRHLGRFEMTTQSKACFTFDAACDAAIEMEAQIFQNFLQAVRIVKDKAANEMLQEAASVRL